LYNWIIKILQKVNKIIYQGRLIQIIYILNNKGNVIYSQLIVFKQKLKNEVKYLSLIKNNWKILSIKIIKHPYSLS
jgi:hypothetical protein